MACMSSLISWHTKVMVISSSLPATFSVLVCVFMWVLHISDRFLLAMYFLFFIMASSPVRDCCGLRDQDTPEDCKFNKSFSWEVWDVLLLLRVSAKWHRYSHGIVIVEQAFYLLYMYVSVVSIIEDELIFSSVAIYLPKYNKYKWSTMVLMFL